MHISEAVLQPIGAAGEETLGWCVLVNLKIQLRASRSRSAFPSQAQVPTHGRLHDAAPCCLGE
jgi:hypothetical protein